MIGATVTLASGGCVSAGLADATGSAIWVLLLEPKKEPNEPPVSQPARPSPAQAIRTASATRGCRRRAAAASVVVTVTSPLSPRIPAEPAADVLTLRRVITAGTTPKDSLTVSDLDVQFRAG